MISPELQNEIDEFVKNKVSEFHQKRIDSIKSLTLSKILQRKNPYLFKAKNVNTAEELVKSLLNAFVSSQEETLFGGLLEDVALFVCSKVFGGQKSGIEGIDLEFNRDGKRYIVSIKSGPNWGNSQQIKKMIENFQKAQRIIRQNAKDTQIVCVNGCCYGKTPENPDKGFYLKLCGKEFWELISGDENLYINLIEPIGHKAKERNEEFLKELKLTYNRLVEEVKQKYCLPNSNYVDWGRFVQFNSKKKEKKKEK